MFFLTPDSINLFCLAMSLLLSAGIVHDFVTEVS